MEKNLHLVIGASENTNRYSNMAIYALLENNKEVVAIGNKAGKVASVSFDTELNKEWMNKVDTVTLYINPNRQEAYYDYISALQPKRVIFNPGTENQAFVTRLRKENIEAISACTLVMLGIGNY